MPETPALEDKEDSEEDGGSGGGDGGGGDGGGGDGGGESVAPADEGASGTAPAAAKLKKVRARSSR